ncbi:MAG: trimeric intracellular cation channel family protein [Pseudomonadota bacterium]
MQDQVILQLLDYFGVFVFALSGALVAARKRMDIFGMLVLALLPAVGGGTLRDLLLDTDVFWIEDVIYVVITGLAVACTFFGFKYLANSERTLMWADALGLAVFSVLGCAKALEYNVHSGVAVMMGIMTAVAGGIMRDVVANDVPYILRQEIYATAALVGAVVFMVGHMTVPNIAIWLGAIAALIVRACGIIFGWSLPKPGIE